jgi:TRAP-type mannitol/chloroaromatic compound transport system permease small subunit
MLMAKMGGLLDKINHWLSWVGGILIALAMVLIFGDVVSRYVFNKPAMSIYYYSEYILLYSTFLAAAYVLQIDRHIRVDIVYNFVSKRTQKIMLIVSDVFGLVYTLFLLWVSSEMVYTAFERGTKFSTPMEHYQYPVLMVIPFGCVLLSLQWIRRINKNIHDFIKRG